MTQHFCLNHGHPDGELLPSLLAYQHATRSGMFAPKLGLLHHMMNSIHEPVQVLPTAFQEHKGALPRVPRRTFGSPEYCTLLHSIWTAFFDRCLIKLPTGEHVSPQYGGAWTLESSSLAHFPTTVIALHRTIRDGTSYAGPGTTPQVSPADSIVSTNPKRERLWKRSRWNFLIHVSGSMCSHMNPLHSFD